MRIMSSSQELVLDFSTRKRKQRSNSPVSSTVTSTTAVATRISPVETSTMGNRVISLEHILSSPKNQFSFLVSLNELARISKSSPRNFDAPSSPVFFNSSLSGNKVASPSNNLIVKNSVATSFLLDEISLSQQHRWASASTAATSLALSALYRRRRRSSPRTTLASDGDSYGRGHQKTTTTTQKDDAYWDKRRKNNQAAKRSRDARKIKENEIAVRAAILEQENCKLKAEVNVLKNEMNRLHCIIFQQSHQKQ
uniref:BZIP domain-containing protein n=1 Tax=Romanomermis culicivorax TaxID=13658 RepID=A0A915HUE8_ROMCU